MLWYHMICWKQKLKRYILDAVVAVFELQEAMCNYICDTESSCGNKGSITYLFTLRKGIYWTNKVKRNEVKYFIHMFVS